MLYSPDSFRDELRGHSIAFAKAMAIRAANIVQIREQKRQKTRNKAERPLADFELRPSTFQFPLLVLPIRHILIQYILEPFQVLQNVKVRIIE